MSDRTETLLVVWGDTVDFRQLITGLALGACLGYLSFVGGLSYLSAVHGNLARGLLMGYALLIGVTGCVLVGVAAAWLFKPKRIFHEEGVIVDQSALFQELGIDANEERERLKSVPSDVIAEMRRLGIDRLFTE